MSPHRISSLAIKRKAQRKSERKGRKRGRKEKRNKKEKETRSTSFLMLDTGKTKNRRKEESEERRKIRKGSKIYVS